MGIKNSFRITRKYERTSHESHEKFRITLSFAGKDLVIKVKGAMPRRLYKGGVKGGKVAHYIEVLEIYTVLFIFYHKLFHS